MAIHLNSWKVINKTVWKHEKIQMNKRYQTDDFDYYFIEIKPPYLRTKYAFFCLEIKSNSYSVPKE
jgi:hypothetical protein